MDSSCFPATHGFGLLAPTHDSEPFARCQTPGVLCGRVPPGAASQAVSRLMSVALARSVRATGEAACLAAGQPANFEGGWHAASLEHNCLMDKVLVAFLLG